jgi:D-aspartate ligase
VNGLVVAKPRSCSGEGKVIARSALPGEALEWDEIVRRFPSHRVTHTRAWLDSMQAARLGEAVLMVLERDREIVGCLPGLIVRVAGWRLFGSPLPGWATSGMGPVFDPQRLGTGEFIDAMSAHLTAVRGVRHIEMIHAGLDESEMQSRGFRSEAVPTLRTGLDPDYPERTFSRFARSARQNVRRAERLGLEIRFGVDDAFAHDHFDQVRQVYRRGGMEVPFSEERLAAGIRAMNASGALLALSAFLPASDIRIATATFLVEGDELQLWMWAHHPHYRWYRATELMTWRAMRHAMSLGCRTFDMMGRGEFKEKFGATLDESRRRWIRSDSRMLAAARPVARAWYRTRQVVRGRVHRSASRVASATRWAAGDGDEGARACVIGDIDLVRALGLRGIRSSIVAPPADAARFSRHTREVLPWHDPWEQPEALVRELLRFAERQSEPPVLFYQDDASLLLVSRERERLAKAFRFTLPAPALIEDLVDKERFQHLAFRLDLPVPMAQAIDPARGPFPTDFAIDGPFVLKPLTRRPARWAPIAGERKALEVASPEALRELWPILANAGLRLIAQALVPGPETGIESYHVYVNAEGERVADFTGRKIRTFPATFGDSSALEITDAPELLELGRELCDRLRLRGVAKFDFKRKPDGGFALLEVNARFTLWHHPAALAGMNVPGLVFDDLAGRRHSAPVPAAIAGVKWCKVWTDHAAARASGIPFTEWLAWALRCEAKRAIAWSDPLPLVEAGLRSVLARSPGLATLAARIAP